MGTRLRFFTGRMFEGVVVRTTPDTVTISAGHGDVSRRETVRRDEDVYRPHGHPEPGEPFRV